MADARKRPGDAIDEDASSREMKKMRASINDVAADLLCPITQELPFDPVIAEDGKIYERSAIANWLRQKATSPVTRARMGTKLLAAVQVRNTIESLIKSGAIEGHIAEAWREKLAADKIPPPPTPYDLRTGDLVVAARAFKRVAVGDRGVVVGPCEDAAEKAPHKRCRVRFDDGKGTYTYTKGQQVRRAPLAGDHVRGDAVVVTRASDALAAGQSGVVIDCARQIAGGLLLRLDATGATHEVALEDLRPAPIVTTPGAPTIRKGDRVVSKVDYETVRCGDRGVVVGPCSEPAMSRADLRVLVDFDGGGSYNYRCDTQILLAPLLDGATFSRGDAVLVSEATRLFCGTGVVVGLGADGRTLNVAIGDRTEDVAPADLTHAPLVADAPQYRKGARVVSRVDYNKVKVGDHGVVVGPCCVRTLSDASKRVLVDFGTGRGMSNYVSGTQLAIAPDNAPGVFPSLDGA